MVPLAVILAEAINPLLLALLLIVPFQRPRPGFSQIMSFWGASAAGLLVAVILAEEGKHLVIWPGHPGFPSGHETFALACAVSLVFWRRIWAWVAVPLALVMGWALVTAGYHHPIEVFGALLPGLWPALIFQGWLLGRNRRHHGGAAPRD